MTTLTDQPFIQFIYNLSVVRIYYCRDVKPHSFFLSEVNLTKIIPLVSPKIHIIRQRLMLLIKDMKNIDMKFYYSSITMSKYKQKINDMNNYYDDDKDIEKLIVQSLIILMRM